MPIASRRRLLLVPLVAGAVAVTIWLAVVGVDALGDAFRDLRPLGVLGMLACTASFLVIRFVRWQYLLRQAGIRVPIRPTISVYLAGLPGTATPAYVGEVIRGLFLRRRYGTPLRYSTAVLVLERLYDVAALGLLAAVFAPGLRAASIGLLFVLLALLAGAALAPFAARIGLDAVSARWLRSPAAVLRALALSLAVWTCAGLLFATAGWTLDVGIPLAASLRTFSLSTLLGAITLLPAGIGGMGSAAIVELGSLGIALPDAVALVTLVRLTSAGAAIALGAVFLVRELRAMRTLPVAAPGVVADAAAHFDEIAEEYNRQWSPHMWDLLLGRKLDLMERALRTVPGAQAGTGLDLGCGLGIQVAEMTRRGYSVVGLDPSSGLLRAGRRRGLHLVAGDALSLPFGDGSLDFVYAIGVLHHLPGRDAQERAYREVARVLKPGGLFLIHESNPRNPLFRFYMGYLFPVLKSIDEGTEWWIDPGQPQAPTDLVREDVIYFTWLPDFTPRALLPMALAAERWLERGPFRSWSAHYMAVLRRTSAGASARAVGEVRVPPMALAKEDA